MSSLRGLAGRRGSMAAVSLASAWLRGLKSPDDVGAPFDFVEMLCIQPVYFSISGFLSVTSATSYLFHCGFLLLFIHSVFLKTFYHTSHWLVKGCSQLLERHALFEIFYQISDFGCSPSCFLLHTSCWWLCNEFRRSIQLFNRLFFFVIVFIRFCTSTKYLLQHLLQIIEWVLASFY